jgi:hypothetical protein
MALISKNSIKMAQLTEANGAFTAHEVPQTTRAGMLEK